jgi:dihydrofolate reductase
MSRIILFNMMTLDGFFEGKNKEIDWHMVDSGFNEFAIAQLEIADALVFGRVTYELMANYWPTEMAMKNDPEVAEKMNAISKIVFSKTLREANWVNTKLIKNNVEQVIGDLKRDSKKNILIFGSADLAATLRQAGLIDEYRVMVNPVLLGEGVSLFKQAKERQLLKLIQTKVFNSGNVLLCYEPC